jgi:hypothetical protein
VRRRFAFLAICFSMTSEIVGRIVRKYTLAGIKELSALTDKSGDL